MTHLWVSWNGATRSHAASRGVNPGDVRNGSFPLMCGRWAPDGWDKDVEQNATKRRCPKCQQAVNNQLLGELT